MTSRRGVDIHQALLYHGILGIVYPGAQAWRTFPSANVATTFSTGSPLSVPGPAQTMVSAGTITQDYYVTHLNTVADQSSPEERCFAQWHLSELDGGRKRMVRDTLYHSTSDYPQVRDVVPPMRVPAGRGLRLALRGNQSDALGAVYVVVLQQQPRVAPELLHNWPSANPLHTSGGLPGAPSGVTVTSSTVAWTYGAYATVDASFGTGAALIYGVTISTATIIDVQAALATGAAASEVDWGVFGYARERGSAQYTVTYDLRPFPLYVPPSTRISARIRSALSGSSVTAEVGVHFMNLPLN